MSLVFHLLILVSYTVAAASAGLVLPAMLPWLDAAAAPSVSTTVFLLAALAHVALTQGARYRVVEEQLGMLRHAHSRVIADLDLAVGEARHVRDTLAQSRQVGNERVSKVVAEVKVLQGLIERLGKRGAGRPPAPPLLRPTTPTPAAAEHMPPVAEGLGDEEVLDVLREGLRLDRVDVYLQPVVSLPQRKIRYYECYTRVRAEDGSIVLPEQYIELAEREGLVGTIDNMLLFRCVQLIRRAQRRSYDTAFFCNISRHSLIDAEFFDNFIEFIIENEDLAAGLIFEFHQSDVDELYERRNGDFRRLAARGFRFSMDQVTKLDLDLGKLAGRNFRFVKFSADLMLQAQKTDASPIDLRDMKQTLDRYNVDLIVEKIERESDLIELLDLNIDFGQGFLFGEPRLSRAA